MSYIPDATRKAVRRAAKDRCGYCLAYQDYVLGRLEIEHIIPTASGGSDDESNLWLACRLYNMHKGVQTHAVDPKFPSQPSICQSTAPTTGDLCAYALYLCIFQSRNWIQLKVVLNGSKSTSLAA